MEDAERKVSFSVDGGEEAGPRVSHGATGTQASPHKEGELAQCVTPSFPACHIRLPVGSEEQSALVSVSEATNAAGQASSSSSAEYSGGPRLNSAIGESPGDDGDSSGDGNTQHFDRQNTTSSVASSASSSSSVSISVQFGSDPRIEYTMEGCEGETVRSCSSDIKEMVQHMSISGAGKATSAPVNESSKNINIAKITKTINKD